MPASEASRGDPVEESFTESIMLPGTAATSARGRQRLVTDAPGYDRPRSYLVGHEPTGFGVGGRRLSPFLGRHAELARLADDLKRVRESGHGRIVVVMGEPGAGKSRLLLEFRRILAEDGTAVLEGRCLSHASASPYFLLIDLVRHALGLGDIEAPDVLGAAAAARLTEAGIQDGVAEILALLRLPAEALIPLTPDTVKQRTFDVLRRLVMAHARPEPAVVILEDLHWGDQTSLEFLEVLANSLPGVTLLLVVSTRPGHRGTWLDRSWSSQLALPPLSTEDSCAVVRSLRPDLDAATVDVLGHRAEGNPFFLEELAWAAGNSGGTDALPATVDAALTARMDRLPAATCQVLEAAAVLGREVPDSLLPVVCGGIDLGCPLSELVDREFLYPRPGSGHVFKHALTQSVAYMRLPTPERERLHALTAAALEASHAGHPDTIIDQLAHHWSRAQHHPKAVEWLGRVSERATAAYALAEAVVAVEQALGHCDRLPPGDERDRLTIQTLTRIVLPLALLGRLGEARDRLAPYSAQVQRLADPRLSGPFFFAMALAHDHTGNHAEAAVVARLSLEASVATEDDLTAGRALAILSHSSLWGGAFRRGLAEGEQAVMYLQRTSDVFWLGISHWIRGHHHLLLGDLSGALMAAAALISLGERTADRRFQSYGHCLQGWAQARSGDVDTGVRACVRAVDLAPDPLARSIVVGYLGELRAAAGEHDLARSHFRAAVTFLRQANFRQLEAWHTARWAETERAARNPSSARDLAGRALDLARDIEFSYVAALATRTLGRMAVIDNVRSDAEAHPLRESLEMFEDVEARYDAAVTRLDLADLCEALGQTVLAYAHRSQARAALSAMGVRDIPAPPNPWKLG
jgi:tetratricopeptide (TPR) repeat protein